MSKINIALITDKNYVIPTVTAMYSVIKNKLSSTEVSFYLVTADLGDEEARTFMALTAPDVSVEIVRASAAKYEGLHTTDPNSPCVASIAALLKFDLPDMLPELDRVLYMDGDLIVREDLSQLFDTPLDECYVAAVVDSGSIYYKHKTVTMVENYFNSGVMLLNLAAMRRDSITERLIEEKKKGDSHLMDQNVFNIVFDGRIKLLPIRYNLLYVSLLRAEGKYTVADINERYGTSYSSLYEIEEDGAIIHYSSKDKPWKTDTAPLADEWQGYYSGVAKIIGIEDNESYVADGIASSVDAPKVSVIIPVYNTGEYLRESLDSIISQSLTEIEIICVNDGSTDNSLDILNEYAARDSRILVISQENRGQSAARNKALGAARGEFVYFFDSDDLLLSDALRILYRTAKDKATELLLFDGTSFFESEQMEAAYAHYSTHYIRKKSYPGVYEGGALYSEMVPNGDFKVSPCLQFFKRDFLNERELRFLEGIIYEDNLFAMQAILLAERVAHLPEQLFRRRVREGSTMTSRPTHRNFRAYFICLLEMQLFIYKNSFSDEVAATAHRQFNHFLKTTATCYGNLPEGDKRKPWIEDRTKRIYADILYDAVVKASDREKAGEVSYSEYVAIQRSFSYRLGRFMTWLPRKIRGGFRCLKEHGFRYTASRVLVHLHLKRDPYK